MCQAAVSETSFFRNRPQFEAFAAVALPDRLAASPGQRPLTILSAGCASGEEPYSLAMVAPATSWPDRPVSVVAIDANPIALAKAARAQYGRWSFRQAPSGAEDRWFTKVGRDAQVIDSVRAMVRFEHRNLADDDPMFWQRGAFDIVFCRNVLMYSTRPRSRPSSRGWSGRWLPAATCSWGTRRTCVASRAVSHCSRPTMRSITAAPKTAIGGTRPCHSRRGSRSIPPAIGSTGFVWLASASIC